MLFFRNKRRNVDNVVQQEEVEAIVSANKKKVDQSVDTATETAEHFKQVVKQNGFTVKIQAAIGGKH